MKLFTHLAHLLAFFALQPCPPHDVRIPNGYLSAQQRREMDAWEDALGRHRYLWESETRAAGWNGVTTVDVIDAGLEESGFDPETLARWRAEYAAWRAARRVEPLAQETQTTI